MLHRSGIQTLARDDEHSSFLAEFVIPVAFGAFIGVALGLGGIALIILRLRVIGW